MRTAAVRRSRKERSAHADAHPWSDSIADLLRSGYRVFARALQERIRAEGIPIGSWPFLRHLWQQDGITQSELTKAVGLMQPNTVAALKHLARRGWVKQTRDATFVEKDAQGRTVNRCEGIAWTGGCTDTNEFNYLVVKTMRSLGVCSLENQARV